MYAQKPHRGCLHNTHIRPEGEAFLFALAVNYAARKVAPFRSGTQFVACDLSG